jgi:hypothetical protein
MRLSPRPVVAALVLLTASLATQPAAGGATHAKVKSPKRGQYIGETGKRREFTLYVGARRAKLVVFDFACGFASGHTTLRNVKLKKSARGYTFLVRGRHKVTYSDRHRSERATMSVSGRFSAAGKSARGRVSVKSSHCGARTARWHATYTSRPVTAPASARYDGQTAQQQDLALYVSGRSIDLAAIAFRCGDATGRTALNAVRLTRTRQGFAFAEKAHGSVSYSDDQPDENAQLDISGHFGPGGKTASGYIRVNSPRCGDTGKVKFLVERGKNSG